MLTLKKIFLAIVANCVLSSCTLAPVKSAPSPAVTLPQSGWSDPAAYSEIAKAVGTANIVQLGESIHLTREMPLVRIGAMKALNQQAAFDVLAVEGSAVDSWLAMDVLFRETGSDVLREAQRRAFFGLWQTNEMREVLKAVADSKKSKHTIYLTSFDSQYGMSVAWRKRKLYEELSDTLISYGLKVNRSKVLNELSSLEGLKLCFQSGFPKNDLDSNGAERAIAQLQEWSLQVSEQVKKKSAIHARALMLLPLNLTNNLALCKTKTSSDPKTPWRKYQEIRDQQNAKAVLAISKQISLTGKVITWAHHSHVHYNSEGRAVPSMGQHLRTELGNKVYTVGTYALSGTALIGQEEPMPEKINDGAVMELSSVFRKISSEDFFLDLRALPKQDARFEAFFKTTTSQTENKPVKVNLANDFDGVIVLQKVSAPKIEF